MTHDEVASATPPADRLKVFVSYARVNVGFADQLVMVLEDKGYLPILDRQDIDAAENWRERLGKLIFSSDACVFVLTAASATSDICRWEVDEAVRLGKRVIPVVPDELHGVEAPAQLSALNWIHFYSDPAIPGSGFYYGVRQVDRALRVDLRWLRQQTKLAEDATEWEAMDRPEDLLMRGLALKDVGDWLQRAPSGTSIPALVREFINASQEAQELRDNAALAQIEKERAQIRRQKRLQLMLGALTLLILISTGIFGLLVWKGQRELQSEKQRVEAERLRGQTSRAQVLSDAAFNQFAAGDTESAMRLAIAGVREGAEVGGVPEANAALIRLLSEETPVRRLRGHVAAVTWVDIDPVGGRIASLSSDGWIIVRTPGQEDRVVRDEFRRFVAAALLPDGSLVTGDDTGALSQWRTEEEKSLGSFEGVRQIVARSRGGDVVVAALVVVEKKDKVVVWSQDSDAWTPQKVPLSQDDVATIGIGADGFHMVIGGLDGTVQVLSAADRTWSSIAKFRAHETSVSSAQLTGDGRVLTVSSDGQLKLWTSGGELVREVRGPEPVSAAALSHSGDLLLMASRSGMVRVVDTATGETEKVVRASARALQGVQFLPEGTTFAAWGDDAEVPIFSVAPMKTSPAPAAAADVQWQRGSVKSAPLSGRLTLGEDGTLRVLADGTGSVVGRGMLVPTGRIVDFALAPDGFTVAAITLKDQLYLFDARSGTDISKPIDHVQEVEFAPDSSALRLVSADGAKRSQTLDTVNSLSSPQLIARACERFVADPGASVVTAKEMDQVVILQERLGTNICGQELAQPIATDGRTFGDIPRFQLSKFAKALVFVLRFEGGYIPAPENPEQAINLGVTQKIYDTFRERQGLDRRGIEYLERTEAQQIYFEGYWLPSQAYRMPTLAQAMAQFDTAVNMGAGKAIRFSQTAAGILADEIWGPMTNRAVLAAARTDPKRFAAELLAQRRRFYEGMVERRPNLRLFLDNWIGRLDALEKEMEPLHDVKLGE